MLAALALSANAQGQGRLSPEDQREFDKYYTKWVNDTRKNDRDDIAKDVGKMQEIMARNGISANAPFDQIASTGGAGDAHMYQGRLSADEQKDFDKYYTKWVNDTRKNDRDDIAKDVRHMQEIMARKNIPANVPFDVIASSGSGPNGAMGPSSRGAWRDGLSPDDRRDFDRYYARWVDDTRQTRKTRSLAMPDTCRRSWPGTTSLLTYLSNKLPTPRLTQQETTAVSRVGKLGFPAMISASSTTITPTGLRTRARMTRMT